MSEHFPNCDSAALAGERANQTITVTMPLSSWNFLVTQLTLGAYQDVVQFIADFESPADRIKAAEALESTTPPGAMCATAAHAAQRRH